MDVLQALQQLHGAARREQLLAVGVRRRALERAVQRGKVVRYRVGCFSLPGAPDAVKAARALRAQLTCGSALGLWGVATLDVDHRVHLAVSSNRGMARAYLHGSPHPQIHHSVFARGASDLTVEPWVAIDHLGRCASPLSQLVAVDSALNRGLLAIDFIYRFTTTDVRRRRWLAMTADGRAESLLETLTRVVLVGVGLSVVPQVRIDGVGRVDLLVDESVVVELDGREYHSRELAFATDRKRDRALQIAGYTVLRFTYREVMFERSRLVEEVITAVRRTAPSPRTL